MAKKAKVEVFVTKTRKFRVNITESDDDGGAKYAVTIGGEMWNQGKGVNHKEDILQKMASIIETLKTEYAKIDRQQHDSCEGVPVEIIKAK